MAATDIALKVKGIDATGNVWKSIGGKAKKLMAGLSLGAVAYAIGRTVAQLGELSDVAQRAGVSAKNVTQLSNALGVLGIKANSADEVAKTFQTMAKNTGRVGMEGFTKTIEEISKLPTVMERSQAAMAAFGKTGLEYLPLIENAAKVGMGTMQKMIEIQPHISDAAAGAGDKVKDAWDTVSTGFQVVWAEAIGKVCEWFDGQFTGGVRQASYVAYSYIREFAAKTLATLSSFKSMMANLGETIVELITAPFTGNSIADVLEQAKIRDDADQAEFQKRFDAIGKHWDEYRKKVEEIAKAGGFDLKTDAKNILGGGGGNRVQRGATSNAWISGGSYAAMTVALREQLRRDDPQTRELKISNNYLKTISQSTAKFGEVAAYDGGVA